MNNYSKLLFALILGLSLVSCNNNKEEINQDKPNTKDVTEIISPKGLQTLTSATTIGARIFVPEGTQWEYVDKSKGSIRFYLPKGYKFLLHNKESDELTLSDEGSYSCDCTGDGVSEVVYINKIFACGEGSCKGSTVGTRAQSEISDKSIIEGVLYMENDKNVQEKASLSELGKKLVLRLPEVKTEL